MINSRGDVDQLRSDMYDILMSSAAPGESNLRELYKSIASAASDETAAVVRRVLSAQVEATAVGKRASIRTALAAAGISGEDSGILRTIVRLQTSLAFNAAGWANSQKNGNLWGYEYVTEGDDKVREAHADLAGTRYPKDHPFWDKYAPINGWNCRCRLRLIFKGDKDARTRAYRGTPKVDPMFQFNPGKIFLPE